MLRSGGLSTRLCVWEKTNPSPMNGDKIWLSGIECCVYGKFKGATFNEFCKNSVFRFPSGRNTYHPTQKPLQLMEHIIKASSNEGDTVLDCCMGSGSTGVAAMHTHRNFVGMELDEGYFKIAEQRIKEAEKQASYTLTSWDDIL